MTPGIIYIIPHHNALSFSSQHGRTHIEIQITEITTSKPFCSPPSYLKLHIPSVFSFQYAPVAECIPLLPTWGLPSVETASAVESLADGAFSEVSWTALALLREEVGTRC